ncbi:MAG: hypothetical protein K5666_01870 [Bacilli bacterium]|nr:hypothetical protein [Bacilli bacterium]
MDEQEDLMALYEQYIDDQTLQEINEADNLEESGYKIVRKGYSEARFPEELLIPISDFVNYYLGITGNCKNLWHSGLKDLGSIYLFGVDNNFANKHPDKVYTGELLLVVDARGNVGTYINPNLIKNLIESEDAQVELRHLRKTGVQTLALAGEYIQKCIELQLQLDATAGYMDLIRATHKVGKYKQLKERIKHD